MGVERLFQAKSACVKTLWSAKTLWESRMEKRSVGLEFREQVMPEAASEVGRDHTMKDLARPWRGKHRDR